MNLKQRIAIVALPAVLTLSVGALAVHAATPNPAPPTSQAEAPEAETAGPAGEVEKADAPGDVQSGHADTGDQADHQATGEE